MAAHSPSNPLAPNFLDRAINAIAPMAGVRRMAAKRLLHEFKYDGASYTNRRENAPAQIAPNSFQVQRDRLQLLREATDLENNFAPAKTLNRKYAMYVAPQGYHAQTGDTILDAAVEEWLNHEWFPKCDHANRADFFRLLEFGVLGMNRGGDYGWAFTRPGSDPSMSQEELIRLPFCLQAIEPDRLGGVYQNIVSEDYVSGVLIGEHGQPVGYRVFKRGMAAGQYTDPIDVPASQFVHYMDTMQLDAYRGVSKLDAAVANLRDLYEMIEFTKGKAKLASALTIFTNSTGASAGIGAMDGYASSQFDNQQSAMAQDIQFGQINHLTAGQDIKFADTSSPGPESQYLMTMLLKMTCMSYNLPYSFGLDATNLGGVSSRLESEQAKAEFTRGQRVLAPLAHRMKDAALMDAIAKGIFPVSSADKICRGRWSYRPHPQPDIGRESSANVSLFQSGLLNPLNYWTEDAQDPEKVASDMVRWAKIKRDKAAAEGFTVEEVFGSGMAKPTNISQSESVSTVAPTPGTEPDTTTQSSSQTVTEFAVKIDPEDLRAATLRELVGLLMDKLPRDQAIAAAYAIYDGDKTRAQLLSEVESELKKEKAGKEDAPKTKKEDAPKNESGGNPVENVQDIKSPKFKSWFGDSKVVDQGGNPIVVYHGTKSKFVKFKDGGVYFSPDKNYAEDYSDGGDVHSSYLSIKNPFVTTEAKYGMNPDNWDYLKLQGYDGIIYKYKSVDEVKAYIPFEASQIKQAAPIKESKKTKTEASRFAAVGERGGINASPKATD